MKKINVNRINPNVMYANEIYKPLDAPPIILNIALFVSLLGIVAIDNTIIIKKMDIVMLNVFITSDFEIVKVNKKKIIAIINVIMLIFE